MGRIPGALHATPRAGSIAARTVDLLQLDGGWLTFEGIAEDLGVNPRTVDRTLYRLRERGWVLSRRRDSGLEWRAA